MTITPTKICRVCKVEKTVTEYHPNKSCSLGVIGTCRDCCKHRLKQWHLDRREIRQKTANERNHSRKAKAVEVFGNKCHDCKQTYPQCVYQFHHLDPTQKDVNPSYAMAGSEETMWKELQKCVMLCANCHMIRHHGGC